MAHYATARSNGHPVMGLGIGDGPRPASTTTYFSTSDIEVRGGSSHRLGASVMMPVMQVMDIGSMAILIDPFGATFGFWQPGVFAGFSVMYEENAPAGSITRRSTPRARLSSTPR